MQATTTNEILDYLCHSVRFNKHQTDQSSFYLCCGYKEVGVNFVPRLVTSKHDRKIIIKMTERFVDS